METHPERRAEERKGGTGRFTERKAPLLWFGLIGVTYDPLVSMTAAVTFGK